MNRRLTARSLAVVIAAAYILLVLAYGLANPPFEATDEIRHFRYVRYLTLNHALPPISAETSKELQAHHPPLYYALAAVVTAPIQSDAGIDYSPAVNPFWGFRYYEPSNDNKAQYIHAPNDRWPFSSGTTLAVYGARWLSSLFGLGLVVMAYRLGQTLFPDKPHIALGAMAFTAFNPTVLHSASSINNDAAVAFFGAWAIVEAVAITQDSGTRWSATRFGLALGLGILSKASALVLLALPIVVYSFDLMRRRENWKSVISNWLLVIGICAAVCGWWFARNYLVTGDPMGFSDYQSAWVGEADRARLIREAIDGLPYAWTTLWARFDYGQVVLPQLAYNLWAVGAGVCLVGLIRTRQQLRTAGMAIVGLAILLALGGWGVLMVTIPATAHARHILYAFPAVGLLFSLGWSGLFSANRQRLFSFGILGFGILEVAFSLYALFAHLVPAFAYPQTVSALPADVTPASANFEGAAEIVGYKVSSPDGYRFETWRLEPGDEVDFQIYWKPLTQTPQPLQVFVHLIDSQGIISAQRDTYPGLGNAVTTSWIPNTIFVDTYRVFISETAYASENLTSRIGLWNTSENRPLVVDDTDAFELEKMILFSKTGKDLIPNRTTINFANQLRLIGYDIQPRVVKPGETLELSTYWHVTSDLNSSALWLFSYPVPPPSEDYWAFVHVVGNDGQIWGLADSVILPFTTEWNPDTVNGETRYIPLDPNIPPGQYVLEFGISHVDDVSQYRLLVIADDGHGLGDHVELTRIRVEP